MSKAHQRSHSAHRSLLAPRCTVGHTRRCRLTLLLQLAFGLQQALDLLVGARTPDLQLLWQPCLLAALPLAHLIQLSGMDNTVVTLLAKVS